MLPFCHCWRYGNMPTILLLTLWSHCFFCDNHFDSFLTVLWTTHAGWWSDRLPIRYLVEVIFTATKMVTAFCLRIPNPLLCNQAVINITKISSATAWGMGTQRARHGPCQLSWLSKRPRFTQARVPYPLAFGSESGNLARSNQAGFPQPSCLISRC